MVSCSCWVECAAVCGLVLASTNTSPAGRLVFFPPELLFLYEETEPSLTFASGLYARVFSPSLLKTLSYWLFGPVFRPWSQRMLYFKEKQQANKSFPLFFFSWNGNMMGRLWKELKMHVSENHLLNNNSTNYGCSLWTLINPFVKHLTRITSFGHCKVCKVGPVNNLILYIGKARFHTFPRSHSQWTLEPRFRVGSVGLQSSVLAMMQPCFLQFGSSQSKHISGLLLWIVQY